jgi:TRAP-type C4-dicarboxylate transport system substrate-binding protein
MAFRDFMGRALQTAVPTAFLAGLAVAAALPIDGASAAEFELKFGTTTTANTALYSNYLVPYARAIEKESGGRIAIDIRPQGGYGSQMDLLRQVESGEVDIVNTLPSYYPGRFPRTSVMELPTMFSNAEQGSRIGWALYKEGLISEDYKTIQLLGLFSGANYAIITKDKTVAGLHDLRGMRIRVSGGVVGLALSRLGMIPLGLPSTLLGRAFDNDWLDAVNIGFEIAASTPSKAPRMVIDEVSTLIDANLSGSMQMLAMNKPRYDSLPADLRAIIDRHSGLKLSVEAGIMRAQSDTDIKNKLATDPRYRFMTFSDDERKEIAARIAPVLDEWAAGMTAQGIDGTKLLTRERELQQQAQPSS